VINKKNGKIHVCLVMVGPHWAGIMVTLALVLSATIVFVKQQCSILPWRYTFFTLCLCFATLYNLYMTCFMDPGIVYSHRHHDGEKSVQIEEENDIEEGHLLQDKTTTKIEREEKTIEDRSTSNRRFVPQSRDMMTTSGTIYRRRYCDICDIEQAKYTEHCEDCGVCIEEYDHHCPWMGKCIGKKNMRSFKLFNASWMIYVAYVIWISIANVAWGEMAIQKIQEQHDRFILRKNNSTAGGGGGGAAAAGKFEPIFLLENKKYNDFQQQQEKQPTEFHLIQPEKSLQEIEPSNI
jgi:hypothetical protein